MKIGLFVGDVRGPATLAEMTAQAQAGFSSVWSGQALGWDALVTLTALGHVPGISLGTAVIPAPQRHPLVLASQALSVQAATGNRLTLGIGAGIGAMVETMFGLPADRPARRMREYLEVLNPLLRGESVSHQGETLTAAGTVQVPGAQPPPVLLAAMGPAMLRLAGELTDGTVTWMTGARTLAGHIVPTISKVARSPRVVAGLLACVTHEEAVVRDRIGAEFAMAGQVPEYRAVFEREGVAGPQDVVIVGDEDSVGRQVDRLRDAGVTEFVAAPYGTAEEQDRTMKVFSALASRAMPGTRA
ncbi:F420-dependent oxidoreductase-like protein [Kibdelosporangium banguiense]|uniref:F420-dependent oxidoreductase-like protein n=1 Tax=Kibdelosporangium banguiense TaxID=1365924 RepID=A0ABS4TJ03_9PSEU|nr:TIGR03564 family F420-dependent LLM class oxidoreductase [Kibdelosporangium banguiense]MBP2324397.1 F420-dependent oxidoreductase-like protein [Kibdelosporangium banguiense]